MRSTAVAASERPADRAAAPTTADRRAPGRWRSGGSDSGGQVDGIAAMAMQIVYPVLKVPFESQIRRITVSVEWTEGSADKTFELTQYFVAEQPARVGTDPNDPNAALNGGTGTGTTGTLGTTGTGLGGTSTGTSSAAGVNTFGATTLGGTR